MSLVPYLLNELLDDEPYGDFGDFYRPRGFNPYSYGAPLRMGYVRPMRSIASRDSGISTITNDKDQFKVNLDVQQFKPEEISVKIADDFLVVDGKHEERKDNHGFISRQFTRRYKLPKDVNLDAMASNISSDGVLSIAAPKKTQAIGGERSIPITMTNQPALKQTKESSASGDQMEQ